MIPETPSTASHLLDDLIKANPLLEPQTGDLVTGRVVSVGQNEVYLDVAGIWTGLIRGPELNDESGDNTKLNVGDEVQATILDLENEQGVLECSFRFAGHKKAWDELIRLRDRNDIMEVKVVDANKGGLMVRLGRVTGFLPVSQLTVEHYPRVEGGNKNRILERLKDFIGQMFKVKVITVEEAESKLIVSERAAWEEKQSEAISKIKVGDVVDGIVSGIVDFGIFVEFGEGLEGLLHISELAWQRIENPSDFVKAGQKLKAKVIGIEDGKISLSMKRLVADPWKVLPYKLGQTVKGKVLKLNPFGAFVELDQDIHGLAHISELSAKKIKDPTEVLTIGQERSFKIISMEPEHHRLGLSVKALKEKIPHPKEAKENPAADEEALAQSTETTPAIEPSEKTDVQNTSKPVESSEALQNEEKSVK